MGENAPMTLSRLAGLARDAAILSGMGLAIMLPVLIALWTVYGPTILEKSGIATAHDVGALRLDLAAARHDLRILAGDDRVVRVDSSRSFVREPVYRGDKVTVVMFLRRTPAGERCIFQGGVTVFEDELGVRLSGSPLKRHRQISTETARLTIETDLPQGLVAGRIVMHLELEYECGPDTRFERTEPIIFRLLER